MDQFKMWKIDCINWMGNNKELDIIIYTFIF